MVADNQTNPQYATLTDAKKKTYVTSSEMSIEFEVDGPYRVRRMPNWCNSSRDVLKVRHCVCAGASSRMKCFGVCWV